MAASQSRIYPDHLELNLSYWDKPLNIKIPTHQWTVLVGETGSGKSYLLTQIATTYILQGHQISMVQQEPYLFNDTIGSNIFLGRNVTDKELQDAKDLLLLFQLDQSHEEVQP